MSKSNRTTVSLSVNTVKKLNIIKGKLISQNGQDRSLDEVINELVDAFEGTQKVKDKVA